MAGGGAWVATLVLVIAFACLLIGTATDSWSTYTEKSDDPIIGTTEMNFRQSYFYSCFKYDQELSDEHTDDCINYQMCKAFDEDGERVESNDVENSKDDDPEPRDNYCDKTRAGQAFCIISVILSFLAACAAGAFAFRKVNHSASGATGLALFAGLVALIPFAIWGDWMENNERFDSYKYDYSFILYTIGWICCFIGSGISLSVKQGYSS
jgi:hypothetical protein